MKINLKLEGIPAKIGKMIGLETPTLQEFAMSVRSSAERINKALDTLDSTNREQVFATYGNLYQKGEENYSREYNPLGSLANSALGTGNNMDAIINPKQVIQEEIEKIQKIIDKQRPKKSEDAKDLVTAWDAFWTTEDIENKRIIELPSLLEKLASSLDK